MVRHGVIVTVVVFASAGQGLAQEASPAPPPADVRVAVGLARQGGIFGDDDPESSSGVGASLSVQVRGQMRRRTGASFEVTFQPIAIRNPHFDESLQTVFLLAGAEIGRTLYVRPAFGIGLQMWSGSSAESAGSVALAAGISIGRRGVGSPRTGIEAIARCAASHGALGWMIGAQVPFSVRK